MMIDSYSFGEIVINGKRYTSDVIIRDDEVKGWWRRVGHEVCLDDVGDVMRDAEIVVFGTGASGCMVVRDEVREEGRRRNIKVVEAKTADACRIYNQLRKEGKKVIAALHLTC